jgi:hypothetical protein
MGQADRGGVAQAEVALSECRCVRRHRSLSITELPCGALQRLEGASFVEVDHGVELVGNPRAEVICRSVCGR